MPLRSTDQPIHLNGTHLRPRRRLSRLHTYWENALMVVLSLNVGLVLILAPAASIWLLVRIADDIGRVMGSWR